METPHITELILGVLGMVLLLGNIIAIVLLIQNHRRHPADPQKLTQRLTRRAWSSGQVGRVAGAFIGLMLFLPLLGLLVPEQYESTAQLFIVLLFAGLQILVLLHFGRVRQSSWKKDFALGRRELSILLVVPIFYFAIIVPIGVVSAAYDTLLRYLWGIEADLQEAAWLIAESSSWARLGYIALAVLIAPFYEELIFRGVLFPFLLQRMGLLLAASTTSLLFAAIHLHLQSAAAIFMLSIALCLAYWRTGSLWASIGLHALFNSVSIIVLCNTVGA